MVCERAVQVLCRLELVCHRQAVRKRTAEMMRCVPGAAWCRQRSKRTSISRNNPGRLPGGGRMRRGLWPQGQRFSVYSVLPGHPLTVSLGPQHGL